MPATLLPVINAEEAGAAAHNTEPTAGNFSDIFLSWIIEQVNLHGEEHTLKDENRHHVCRLDIEELVDMAETRLQSGNGKQIRRAIESNIAQGLKVRRYSRDCDR